LLDVRRRPFWVRFAEVLTIATTELLVFSKQYVFG
jgi:hypothetical protein